MSNSNGDYDNKHRGALFAPDGEQLVRRGTITDGDGNEHRCIVVKCTTQTGKEVFEVYAQAGAMFHNDKRESDSHPTAKGSVTLGGREFWLSAWPKESRDGKAYTSVAITPKDQRQHADQGAQPRRDAPPPRQDDHGDIPF